MQINVYVLEHASAKTHVIPLFLKCRISCRYKSSGISLVCLVKYFTYARQLGINFDKLYLKFT